MQIESICLHNELTVTYHHIVHKGLGVFTDESTQIRYSNVTLFVINNNINLLLC